jgi:hypothetical protein
MCSTACPGQFILIMPLMLHVSGETPATFTETKALAFRAAVAKVAKVQLDHVTILQVKESTLTLRRHLLASVPGIEVVYEVTGGYAG